VPRAPAGVTGRPHETFLQEPIESAGGGGVLCHVFAQVTGLPARLLGLAEEHVQQRAFVAGLVPGGEQLVGEGLVEQAGHRTGAALGRGRLEQVVGAGAAARRVLPVGADKSQGHGQGAAEAEYSGATGNSSSTALAF
jgi:hypothetical protein